VDGFILKLVLDVGLEEADILNLGQSPKGKGLKLNLVE
jgi:hypothetical protein